MQISLNISGIDLYSYPTLRHVLPVERKKTPGLRFSFPYHVKFECSWFYPFALLQNIHNSSTTARIKNRFIDLSEDKQDSHCLFTFECSLAIQRKQILHLFFQLLPPYIQQRGQKAKEDALVPKRIIRQVRSFIDIDHYLVSCYLHQNTRITFPMLESSRQKLLSWFNQHFKEYLSADLPSLVVARPVLNSELACAAIKKIALKKWANELESTSSLKTILFCQNKSEKKIREMQGDHFFTVSKLFHWMTNAIMDAMNKKNLTHEQQISYEEELNCLASDIARCLEITHLLIKMTYYSEELKLTKGRDVLEKARLNPRLPYDIFYTIYQELASNITGEIDVYADFENHAYHQLYFQISHYAIMRILGAEEYPLEPQTKKIFHYLEGKQDFNACQITEQNGREILTTLKIIDVALVNYSIICQRSSYSLRQHILRVSSHTLTTNEIYTTSPNPANYTNTLYLADSKNWINERVARQAKLIIDHNILSSALSNKLKSIVFATRGNTGVGKSFWVRQFIEEYLKENEQLGQGVLNPDLIKASLKRIVDNGLLNSQVYMEGRILFEKLLEFLTTHLNKMLNVVVDTRLLTIEEFEQVLALAKSRGNHLEIRDVDASIWHSILSVLNREPFSKDPCVPFEVIKDGFMRARQYRSAFIERCCQEKVNYSLYRVTKTSDITLIVEIRDQQFNHPHANYLKYCKTLSDEQIKKLDRLGATQITEELIFSLPFKKKEVLRKWKGTTIQEALLQHAQGKKNLLT